MDGGGADLGIEGLGPGTQIGEGGSAVVYRARQEDLDRDVAVKLLRLSADPDSRRRFDRERRLMGRLSRHEGIVTVHATGFNTRGEPYIVMPLLSGSLDDEIQAQPMPWPRAVDLIIEVCEIVGFAHEEGVVHRDLKPANIMLSASGRPLVADFGIARVVDTNTQLAATALTLTPAYSPPEAIETTLAQPTADVYSLGATLYALIMGYAPYTERGRPTTLTALVHRIVNDPVPDVGTSAPPEIQAVLERALAKSPRDRFPTVRDFGKALADARRSASSAQSAVTVHVTPETTATGSRGRTVAVIVGVVACVLVMIGIGVGVVAVLLGDDEAAPSAVTTVDRGSAVENGDPDVDRSAATSPAETGDTAEGASANSTGPSAAELSGPPATGPGCTIAATAVATSATQSDCDALLAVYASTGGESWTDSTGWNTPTDPCAWYGVTCDGGVVGLDLDDNGLSGSIPPEIGGLGELDSLSLATNALSGELPAEIARIPNLRTVFLISNELSGPIPAEWGELGELETLYLGFNRLSGPIPVELSGLSRLQVLDLANNELSGEIPSELSQLSDLGSLDLGGNEFSGSLPPELGDLARLVTLAVGQNRLSGEIPPELGSLTDLEVLTLSSNEFSGAIPDELGTLPRLDRLSLGFNELSGEIPAALGDLERLTSLSLVYNELTGPIPSELGQLSALTYLGLFNNMLVGEVPAELAELTLLESLELSDNQLAGPLPTEITSLSGLTELTLTENGCLTADAPTEEFVRRFDPDWNSGCSADPGS